MNKFERSISTGNTLAERGSIVAAQARREQENMIRTLETNIDSLKLNLYKLTDIAPDNTTSLKPSGLATENPKQWVADVHQAKVRIAELEVELEIARETLDEWFSKEEVL